ncbi:MAG TPA: CoA transferase [Hyphomicrobiaceae bacterium]|jgi:crotonobetainyl-CoA:carnitine CoA-transferase CaiB-like acyl-CoA transferase|nr:CoA transferase [Hyphomicrobiaceae bacterium]
MSYEAPFAGLKVVDLSQGVAGPYCGMLLAQYGADVIKVEPTGEGDWARTLGTRYGDQSAYSIPANLGKRSVALDLKSPEGKEVLWRLIAGADVLLEGFRPGVLGRLGFGYEAVSQREPRILYLSVSGFGQTGPLSGRPAMDPVLQAFTGLMADNKGEDGIPHRVPFIVIDMSTALYAFQALSAALYARRDQPRGRRIEVSLMQAASAMQVIRTMMVYLEGEQVRRAMPSGVFKTADGWLQFLVIRNENWIKFCNIVLGTPELARDPRFINEADRMTNEAPLLAIVRAAIAGKPTAYWAERLREADIMHERLNTFREFLKHPQTEAMGLIGWLDVEGVPEPVPVPNVAGLPPLATGTPRATPPRLGQHTGEVLREHGFSAADIAGLVERKVVSQA